MQTITLWVLFQTLPFFQPLVLADTLNSCSKIITEIVERSTEDNKGYVCKKIELLKEGV